MSDVLNPVHSTADDPFAFSDTPPNPYLSHSQWVEDRGITIEESPVDSLRGYRDYLKGWHLDNDMMSAQVSSEIDGHMINKASKMGLLPEPDASDYKIQAETLIGPTPISNTQESSIVRRAFGEDAGAQYLQLLEDPEADRAQLTSTLNDAKALLVRTGELPFATIISKDGGQRRVIGGSAAFNQTLGNAFRESVNLGAVDFVDAAQVFEKSRQLDADGRSSFELDALSEIITEITTGADVKASALSHVYSRAKEELLEIDAGKRDEFSRDTILMARGALGTAFARKNDLKDINVSGRFSDEDIDTALKVMAAGDLMTDGKLKFYEDPDDLYKNIRIYGGIPVAPIQVLIQNDLFEASMVANKNLTGAHRKQLRQRRKATLTALFPAYDKMFTETSATADKWVDARAMGQARGLSKESILSEFVSNPRNYSHTTNTLSELGAYGEQALTGLFTFIGNALGIDASLKYSLKEAEERSRRMEVARVFGEEFGTLTMTVGTGMSLIGDILGMFALSRMGAGAYASVALRKSGANLTGKGVMKNVGLQLFRQKGRETAAQTAQRIYAAGLINASSKEVAKTGITKAIKAYNKAIQGVGFNLTTQSMIWANRSSGQMYVSVYGGLDTKEDGTKYTHDEKHDVAMGAALQAGAFTVLITNIFRAMGWGGFERAFERGASFRQMKGILDKFAGRTLPDKTAQKVLTGYVEEARGKLVPMWTKKMLWGRSRDALHEGLEEGIDELAQSFIEAAATNKDRPMLEHLNHALIGAKIGAILGGVAAPAARWASQRFGRVPEASRAEFEQQQLDNIIERLRESSSPLAAEQFEARVRERLSAPKRTIDEEDGTYWEDRENQSKLDSTPDSKKRIFRELSDLFSLYEQHPNNAIPLQLLPRLHADKDIAAAMVDPDFNISSDGVVYGVRIGEQWVGFPIQEGADGQAEFPFVTGDLQQGGALLSFDQTQQEGANAPVLPPVATPDERYKSGWRTTTFEGKPEDQLLLDFEESNITLPSTRADIYRVISKLVTLYKGRPNRDLLRALPKLSRPADIKAAKESADFSVGEDGTIYGVRIPLPMGGYQWAGYPTVPAIDAEGQYEMEFLDEVVAGQYAIPALDDVVTHGLSDLGIVPEEDQQTLEQHIRETIDKLDKKQLNEITKEAQAKYPILDFGVPGKSTQLEFDLGDPRRAIQLDLPFTETIQIGPKPPTPEETPLIPDEETPRELHELSPTVNADKVFDSNWSLKRLADEYNITKKETTEMQGGVGVGHLSAQARLDNAREFFRDAYKMALVGGGLQSGGFKVAAEDKPKPRAERDAFNEGWAAGREQRTYGRGISVSESDSLVKINENHYTYRRHNIINNTSREPGKAYWEVSVQGTDKVVWHTEGGWEDSIKYIDNVFKGLMTPETPEQAILTKGALKDWDGIRRAAPYTDEHDRAMLRLTMGDPADLPAGILEEFGKYIWDDPAPAPAPPTLFSQAGRITPDAEYVGLLNGDNDNDNLQALLHEAPPEAREGVLTEWMGRNPESVAALQELVDIRARETGHELLEEGAVEEGAEPALRAFIRSRPGIRAEGAPVPQARRYSRATMDTVRDEAEARVRRGHGLGADDSLTVHENEIIGVQKSILEFNGVARDEVVTEEDVIEVTPEAIDGSAVTIDEDGIIRKPSERFEEVEVDVDATIDERSPHEVNVDTSVEDAVDAELTTDEGRARIQKLVDTAARYAERNDTPVVVLDVLNDGRAAAWFDSESGSVFLNPAGIARATYGMSRANARRVVRSIMVHEQAHRSSWSELWQSDIDHLVDRVTDAEYGQIINEYYLDEGTRQKAFARLTSEDASESFTEKRLLVEERLRMTAERTISGFTQEEDLLFYRKNPSFLKVVIRYLHGYLNRLMHARRADEQNPYIAEASRNMIKEIRRMRGEGAASFSLRPDPDNPQEALVDFYSQLTNKRAVDALYTNAGAIDPASEDATLDAQSLRQDTAQIGMGLTTRADGSRVRIPGTVFFAGGGLKELFLPGVNWRVVVEYQPEIAAAHAAAHGSTPTVQDVSDFVNTAENLERIPENGYFTASPVCKNYSSVSNAVGDSDLDIKTASAVARVIEERRPAIFTLENVKEYAFPPKKGGKPQPTKALDKITKALDDGGYTWHGGIYNAADYGAPTSRIRYLIRATRHGTELPPIPKPTHGPETDTPHLGWYDTVKDIIEDLPESSITHLRRAKYIYEEFAEHQDMDPENVPEPILVAGTKKDKRTRVARPDEPAFTILATHKAVMRILLPGGRVKRVTARAKARMMGLPDSFSLPTDVIPMDGTPYEKWTMEQKALEKVAGTVIGNGVPPALSAAVFGPLIQQEITRRGEGTMPDLATQAGSAYVIREGATPGFFERAGFSVDFNAELPNLPVFSVEADTGTVPVYAPDSSARADEFIEDVLYPKLRNLYVATQQPETRNYFLADDGDFRRYVDDEISLREFVDILKGRGLELGYIDELKGINRDYLLTSTDDHKGLPPLKEIYTQAGAAGTPTPTIDDTRYLELAQNEKANRVELRRMVNAWAKAAGYITRPVYHAGPEAITIFDPTKTEGQEGAFFFADNEKSAINYAKWGGVRKPEVVKAFLKMDNPKKYTDFWRDFTGARLMRAPGSAPLFVDLEAQGYDSVEIESDDWLDSGKFPVTGKQFIILNRPQNIKSAELVTRDADGNIIPLSQRFDVGKPSILETQAGLAKTPQRVAPFANLGPGAGKVPTDHKTMHIFAREGGSEKIRDSKPLKKGQTRQKVRYSHTNITLGRLSREEGPEGHYDEKYPAGVMPFSLQLDAKHNAFNVRLKGDVGVNLLTNAYNKFLEGTAYITSESMTLEEILYAVNSFPGRKSPTSKVGLVDLRLTNPFLKNVGLQESVRKGTALYIQGAKAVVGGPSGYLESYNEDIDLEAMKQEVDTEGKPAWTEITYNPAWGNYMYPVKADGTYRTGREVVGGSEVVMVSDLGRPVDRGLNHGIYIKNIKTQAVKGKRTSTLLRDKFGATVRKAREAIRKGEANPLTLSKVTPPPILETQAGLATKYYPHQDAKDFRAAVEKARKGVRGKKRQIPAALEKRYMDLITAEGVQEGWDVYYERGNIRDFPDTKGLDPDETYSATDLESLVLGQREGATLPDFKALRQVMVEVADHLGMELMYAVPRKRLGSLPDFLNEPTTTALEEGNIVEDPYIDDQPSEQIAGLKTRHETGRTDIAFGGFAYLRERSKTRAHVRNPMDGIDIRDWYFVTEEEMRRGDIKWSNSVIPVLVDKGNMASIDTHPTPTANDASLQGYDSWQTFRGHRPGPTATPVEVATAKILSGPLKASELGDASVSPTKHIKVFARDRVKVATFVQYDAEGNIRTLNDRFGGFAPNPIRNIGDRKWVNRKGDNERINVSGMTNARQVLTAVADSKSKYAGLAKLFLKYSSDERLDNVGVETKQGRANANHQRMALNKKQSAATIIHEYLHTITYRHIKARTPGSLKGEKYFEKLQFSLNAAKTDASMANHPIVKLMRAYMHAVRFTAEKYNSRHAAQDYSQIEFQGIYGVYGENIPLEGILQIPPGEQDDIKTTDVLPLPVGEIKDAKKATVVPLPTLNMHGDGLTAEAYEDLNNYGRIEEINPQLYNEQGSILPHQFPRTAWQHLFYSHFNPHYKTEAMDPRSGEYKKDIAARQNTWDALLGKITQPHNLGGPRSPYELMEPGVGITNTPIYLFRASFQKTEDFRKPAAPKNFLKRLRDAGIVYSEGAKPNSAGEVDFFVTDLAQLTTITSAKTDGMYLRERGTIAGKTVPTDELAINADLGMYVHDGAYRTGDIISKINPYHGGRWAPGQSEGVAYSAADDASRHYFYGLGNLDEFVTEAFTSVSFQQYLASIPSEEDPNRSVLQVFLDILVKILEDFGLKGIKVKGTVLEDAMQASLEVAGLKYDATKYGGDPGQQHFLLEDAFAANRAPVGETNNVPWTAWQLQLQLGDELPLRAARMGQQPESLNAPPLFTQAGAAENALNAPLGTQAGTSNSALAALEKITSYDQLTKIMSAPALEIGDYEDPKGIMRYLKGDLDPRVKLLDDFRKFMLNQSYAAFRDFNDNLKMHAENAYGSVENAPSEVIAAAIGSVDGLKVPPDVLKRIEEQLELDMQAAEAASIVREVDPGAEGSPQTMAEADAQANAQYKKLKAEAEARAVQARHDAKVAVRKKLLKDRDAALAEIRSRPNGGAELADTLVELRRYVDALSDKVVEVYGVNPELKIHIDLNKGLYLTRSYRMFHEEDWAERILHDEGKQYVDIRNRAAAYIEETYVEERWPLIQESSRKIHGGAGMMSEEEARAQALTEVEGMAMHGKSMGDQAVITLVTEYRDQGASLAGMGGKGEGYRPLIDNLRKRKTEDELPQEIRDLLGEYGEESYFDNLLRTQLNLSVMVANQSFITQTVQLGRRTEENPNGWLLTSEQLQEAAAKDPDTYQNYVPIRGKQKAGPKGEVRPDDDEGAFGAMNEGMAPSYDPLLNAVDEQGNLAGELYGPKELLEGLRASFEPAIMNKAQDAATDFATGLQKWASKLTGVSLGVKTMGSVGFYTRNIMSNMFFFGPAQGFVSLPKMAKKLVAEGKRLKRWDTARKLDAQYAEYILLGIVGDEIRPGVIMDLLKGGTTPVTLMNDADKLLEEAKDPKFAKATKHTKLFLEKLRDVTAAVDAFYKVAYYENELAVMLKAREYSRKRGLKDDVSELSDTELKKAAARKVLKTAQSYSQSPPFVKGVGKSWYGIVFAPFLRFRIEVPRILLNTMKISKEEMASKNPIIRRRGRIRAGSSIAVVGGLSAAVPILITKVLGGVTDDEDKFNRKSSPHYLRGHTFFIHKGELIPKALHGFLGVKDPSKKYSWDLTYMNPFTAMVDPLLRSMESVFRGDMGDAASRFMVGMVTSQFMDEQIFFGAAQDIFANTNPDTGNPIYEDMDTLPEVLMKTGGFLLGEAYAPPTLERVWKKGNVLGALTGEVGMMDPIAALFREILPVKPYELNPQKQLERYLTDKREEYDRVRMAKRKMKREVITESAIRDIARTEIERRRRINEELLVMFKGAEDAGLSKQTIYGTAKAKGFGKRRLILLDRGYMERPMITRDLQRELAAKGPEYIERMRVFMNEVNQYPRYITLD